jgi:hypothetical protein
MVLSYYLILEFIVLPWFRLNSQLGGLRVRAPVISAISQLYDITSCCDQSNTLAQVEIPSSSSDSLQLNFN